MITIFDVATKAGVSKSTVSRVINGGGPVKEETRRKILSAMEELEYYPNYFARGMRIKKTHSIGIVVPDYANPFYAETFRGIETVTQKAGFLSFMCVSDADPEKECHYLKEMLKREIEGIIIFSYTGSSSVIRFLMSISKQKPIVVMDPILQEEELTAIHVDGRKSTEELVRYVGSKGKKRIAYIRGHHTFVSTQDRYRGFLQGMEEMGVNVDPDFIYEGDFTIAGGMKAVEYFRSLNKFPEAILATTDVMAIGALKACKQADIRIPQDVVIAGFDDISLAGLVDPPLTTVSQPIIDIGVTAAQLLVDQIEKGEGSVYNRIVMPGTLEKRASTGD